METKKEKSLTLIFQEQTGKIPSRGARTQVYDWESGAHASINLCFFLLKTRVDLVYSAKETRFSCWLKTYTRGCVKVNITTCSGLSTDTGRSLQEPRSGNQSANNDDEGWCDPDVKRYDPFEGITAAS